MGQLVKRGVDRRRVPVHNVEEYEEVLLLGGENVALEFRQLAQLLRPGIRASCFFNGHAANGRARINGRRPSCVVMESEFEGAAEIFAAALENEIPCVVRMHRRIPEYMLKPVPTYDRVRLAILPRAKFDDARRELYSVWPNSVVDPTLKQLAAAITSVIESRQC